MSKGTLKMKTLQFKQAKQNDSELLTETAFKSKKIWNYSDEQMSLWTSELTITGSYIQSNKVFNIYKNENFVGFCSLVYKDTHIEIDHFWLLPENTGKGYGKKTFDFIKATAKKGSLNIIMVYAEPNSNGFYIKMGGKLIQRKESKIKGRFLNVYKFEV